MCKLGTVHVNQLCCLIPQSEMTDRHIRALNRIAIKNKHGFVSFLVSFPLFSTHGHPFDLSVVFIIIIIITEDVACNIP